MGKPKVVVVMPAYNAEKTLHMTYAELPHDIVDLVILVDDRTRTVSAYSSDGSTTTFGDGSTFAPEAFPGLEFPLSEIFAELDVP